MKTNRPSSMRSQIPASLRSLFLALPLITGPALYAQTWQTNTAGNTTWSTASSWDPALPPVSGTTTVVNFFTANTTVSAGTNIAFNDISPMVVNQLNISGVGGASAATLTIQGSGITFDGTTPQLNINPASGSGAGYTFTLAAPLTFNAPTTITLGSGSGFITSTSASTWNGSGNVTLVGSLTSRPLSLLSNNTTYSGEVTLSGNATVLQLNNVNNSLGVNTANTQSVTIGSGSGVNVNYGNGAYINAQNFILNGTGNAGTNNTALNVTRIGFGNGTIGGLALNSNAALRVQMETAGEARGVTVTRGILGSGDLVKTGNGYLVISANATASTWGGTAFSRYTGNITIAEGVLQTPNLHNALGNNTSGTQRVTVNAGAAMTWAGATGTGAYANPQNFVLNGSGTGYVANSGGFAALTVPGLGFGNAGARSIILASDASVAIQRGSDGPRGLDLTRGLAGNGTLTVGALFGVNVGALNVNIASAPIDEFPAFSGKIVINNGILTFNNANSLGTSTTGQIHLSGLGTVSSSITGGPNQAFIDRISNASSSAGVIATGVTCANALDFTNFPSLRLGATASVTYNGTITPGANGYNLGGGGSTLTVSSALTGATPLNVGGGVTLTSANNTFSGGITIAGTNTGTDFAARLNYTNGTGLLPSSNSLTFAGIGGTFAYATPISTNSTSQTLGNVSFSEGAGLITATAGNSTIFGSSTLTLSALSRTAGATGTLSTVNGNTTAPNKIAVTGLTNGFVDKGIYFTTTNYAYYDSGNGTLRAPVYGGSDEGFVTSVTASSLNSATHQQITGNITAQGNATFTTLRINGNAPLNIGAGNIVTTDGLLKTGGVAVTIAGPGVIQASSGAEMVINNSDAAATLTIGASIVNNGDSSLTKTGPGTVTLTGVSTNYNGGTTINQGTFVIGTSATISNTGPILINGGTLQLNNNKTAGAVTLKNGVITGFTGGTGTTPSALTGSSYALQNGGVTAVLAGPGAVTKTTEGYVYLSANNTYSGGTTVSAGSIGLVGFGSFGNGTLTISGGRVDLGGKTITNTLGPITGGGSLHNGAVVNNGGTYELQNGVVTVVLSGTNGLNKTSNGTLTLSANNTYTGPTTLTNGSLALGASSLPGGGLGASKVVLSTGTSLDVSGVTASTVTLSGGLGGNGTVNATGKTLLVSGSFTPGVMTINGNLAFDSSANSTFVPATSITVNGGTVTNNGTLTINAPGLVSGGNLTFFTAPLPTITPGYSGVTVNAVPLTQASAGVWTATNGGLIYTYTETNATLALTSSNTAPTISDITNSSIPSGSSTPPLAFTVGDAETAPALLTVSGASSNPSLVPNGNIVFGGTGANRTVTVTPISGNTGTTTITVMVTDGGSPSLSNITPETFVLTVTESFVSWAKTKGIEGQPATGDFDNDGISNLMEYALNGNPTVANTSILPQITGTGPLKLTFYRNGDANITYIVEARDDLVTGTWVEKYNSFGTTYTPGLFEVTDSGQVGNKRFMRLRVTAP